MLLVASPGSAAPAVGTRTQNNFDAVRLAAALCVLLSHQFALWGLAEPSVLGVHSLGGAALLVFFSISGFLVAQSWEADPHAGRFAARRLLRIWPGLAVAVLLAALVLGPLMSSLKPGHYFADPAFARYFKHLIFVIHDALPGVRFDGSALPTAINGALWSIPLEVRCYLLLGLLAAMGLTRLRGRWVLLLVLLAMVTVYMVWTPGTMGWANPWHISEQRRLMWELGTFFFAGTAIHAFRIAGSAKRTAIVLAACWLLGGAALAAQLPLLALWLVFPCTTIAVCTASTAWLRRAGRFGDFSYGIYIYAFPVQQTVVWLFKDRLPWAGALAVTLAITLTLAFASWHLVEKRALRFKPGRRAQGSRQPAGQPQPMVT